TLALGPTLGFRKTWAWGLPGWDDKPEIRGYDRGVLLGRHRVLGRVALAGSPNEGRPPEPLVCDNESNAQRLWGLGNRSPYPKDGINDYIVDGKASVNPDRVGTKAGLHYTLTVAPGQTTVVRLRLARVGDPADDWSPGSTAASAGTRASAGPHAASAGTRASAGQESALPRLDLRRNFDSVMNRRRREADEFF